METKSPFSDIKSQLDNIPENVPVVFISYSWDSEEHKEWVLHLSDDLRKKYGIYTLLDRYNRGGDDIVTFMNKGIRGATRVLIIGTPNYKKKLEKNSGGAKFEDQIITISIYHEMESSKFVPVLREGKFEDSFSELLGIRTGYDMSDDSTYDQRLVELAADLWGTPINHAPALGPKPNFTPASCTLKDLVPTSPRDFATIVKMYILDAGKQIVLTEMIEDESKKALNEILKYADYNHITTSFTFNTYIQNHQHALENLKEAVLPIVRYGTIEQQKLLVNACVMLCYRPIHNGQLAMCETENVHLLASIFLFHTIGVAAIHYEKYELIDLLHKIKVPAPNIIGPMHAVSLAYLSGCTRWDSLSLNSYLNSNWIYPYSQMVKSQIWPTFSDVFLSESDFYHCYHTWEHLSSMLMNYNKCYLMDNDVFPMGDFISQRVSLYRPEDNFYTDFFRKAKNEQDEWLPIKQGLFDGKYENFESTYIKAEEYYRNNRYC